MNLVVCGSSCTNQSFEIDVHLDSTMRFARLYLNEAVMNARRAGNILVHGRAITASIDQILVCSRRVTVSNLYRMKVFLAFC